MNPFHAARLHALLPRLLEAAAQWRKLPAREKNIHAAVAVAIVAALYFGLIWPLGHARLTKLEYDREKQAVREKTLAKQAAATPLAPPPSLGNISLQQARVELESLSQRTEAARGALAKLHQSFVPLDDSLALNILKSGLTNLAEAGDMEVLALEHIYPRAEDKDKPPTPQLIRESAQNNPFKRPLIFMRARASYRGLMQFLDGLVALPYVAAPVWSDITVSKPERRPDNQTSSKQWLEVQIKFAI